MNILKIQQDILKSLVKGSKLYKFTVDDANIGIIYNNVIAYIIPRDKFLISVEHINEGVNDKIAKFLNGDTFQNYEKATLQPQLIMLSTVIKPNELIQKISGEAKHTWAQRKFINQFSSFATFAINGPKDPIQVFENGVYVGIIMPFKTEIDNNEQEDNL